MNENPGTAPGAHIGDDEFIDLVSDFLDDAGRARVIAHASACAHCDARFREISATHERGLARAKQMLADPVAAPRANPFGRPFVALLAAAGFLVVAASIFLARSRPQAPASLTGQPEPAWLPSAVLEGNRRSGEASQAESLVIAGVQAYDRRDLAEAERLLRATLEPGAIDNMRRLYLANALVEQGRDGEAIPLLEGPYGDLLPEPWNAEWGWTFFVALQRQGQQQRADSVLETLVKRDDEVGKRARAVKDGRHPQR